MSQHPSSPAPLDLNRQRKLAKDRAITVDLERSFSWQVDDGVLQTERVPTEQNAFEVIIRP